MEQVTVHMVLILKGSWHTSLPLYVARYDASNSGFEAFKLLEYRVLNERRLENKQNKKQSHKHLFVKCNLAERQSKLPVIQKHRGHLFEVS